MRTVKDLEKYYTEFVDTVQGCAPEIGIATKEWDDCGYCDECDNSKTNTVRLEKDGWLIEAEFECWGRYDYDESENYGAFDALFFELNWVSASYDDPATHEGVEFDEEQLQDLYELVNKTLKEMEYK